MKVTQRCRRFARLKFSIIGIVLFGIVFGGIGIWFFLKGPAATAPIRSPIISTGVPIISTGTPMYSNGVSFAAGQQNGANDNNYSTNFCNPNYTPTPTNPWHIAYDLSGVPSAKRGQVVAIWFASAGYNFDLSYFNDTAYNFIKDYTIDVNSAPGGSYPTTGWLTKATVTDNTWISRQNVVDMTGHNWIQINVTGNRGSDANNGACVANFDIHDASAGVSDNWMFFGDSITANAMNVTSGTTFAQLINQAKPKYFPIMQAGGIGGLTSADGAAHMATWLQNFPGHYVGISLGGSDAHYGVTTTQFYDNYATMVQAILTAGKIPVVPQTGMWRCTDDAVVQSYNTVSFPRLFHDYPQIIQGPDLYGFFSQPKNQTYIRGNDCVHLTEAGNAQYRNLWANKMLTAVYNKLPVH
jgi:hypothetical protein